MLKHYLAVTTRLLRRQRGYTIINLAGLSVGLAGCLLLLGYVRGERAVDDFHARGDRMYRLVKHVASEDGTSAEHAITSGAMGPQLAADFPEVEAAVRVFPWFDPLVFSRGETHVQLPDVSFVDANFFDVFGFRLLRGDPATVLSRPLTLVLTETAALRLFGEADPVGQTVRGPGDFDYTVTGLAADPPDASHLRFDALVSWTTTEPEHGALRYGWANNWLTQLLYTYVVLRPGADAAALEAKLPAFMERHFADRADQYRLYLQPFGDVYLGSSHFLHQRSVRLGDAASVRAFSIVAFLLLLIACINFTNLSTARAAKRAREVGVRKALGATRGQLVRQFLGESILLSLVALVFSIALLEGARPLFAGLTGRPDVPLFAEGPALLAALLGLALGVGLLAGGYPAGLLSAFRPARALRGSQDVTPGGRQRGAGLRKALVVSQFTVSIVLIAGTTVVFRQMAYTQHKDLGIDREQVVTLPIGSTGLGDQVDAVEEQLLRHPGIRSVARSGNVPGRGPISFEIVPEGKPDTETWTAATIRLGDDDLLETYGMTLVEGRYFSDDRTADAAAGVVINETLAERLGWREPLGRRLDVAGELTGGVVIGVVRDFHIESLRVPIEPTVLIQTGHHGFLSLRLTGENLPGTLAHVRTVWEAFEDRAPFDYTFLDDAFARFYEADRRLMMMLGLFAGLAVFVACLGLFGLAAFVAEQRTKEIGIRKVLGATVPGLVGLLSGEYLRLVGLAFVVAAPVAYLVADRWLEGFAYRIDVGAATLLFAGALALGIALATVSCQSLRAAAADPVKSLRYE